MFGRTKSKEVSKNRKQTRRKSETDKIRVGKRRRGNAQKGRGKRAQEAIREQPQPRRTRRQPNAGPPLKIGDGKAKKLITGTTPEEVVKNIRRQKR